MKFQEGVFDGRGCGVRRQTETSHSYLYVPRSDHSLVSDLKKEVKKSLDRPIGFKEAEAPRISRRQML
jgi:hypothetical protein